VVIDLNAFLFCHLVIMFLLDFVLFLYILFILLSPNFHLTSNKLSPNFHQTSNKHSPNLQQTSPNFHKTSNKLSLNCQQTFTKHSPNFHQTFKLILSKFLPNFHQNLTIFYQTFTKLLPNFLTNFQQFFETFNKLSANLLDKISVSPTLTLLTKTRFAPTSYLMNTWRRRSKLANLMSPSKVIKQNQISLSVNRRALCWINKKTYGWASKT
jgi:hypothetical protein